MNPSTLLMKYEVQGRSIRWCSCGITLSSWTIVLVCLLRRAMREMVPKQGPMNGVQYFMSSMSGRSRRMRSPMRIQLKGLTVFTHRSILRFSGAGESVYWLLPGNRNEGYCTVKVLMSASQPRDLKVRARISMMEAMPPRYGCAGPRIVIFFKLCMAVISLFAETVASVRNARYQF